MAGLRVLLSMAVCVAVASPLSAAVVSSLGAPERGPPPDGPDHGLNVSTFYRLWSGDADDPDAAPPQNATREEALLALLNSTDSTFERPPAAASQWNAGDHLDFEPGGIDRSVHPAGANLSASGPVRDAYVRTFAVTPSTVLHRGNRTETYVAPTGSVRAILDYRLAVPENDTTGPRRVGYAVERSTVAVELRANGSVVDVATNKTPVLRYSNLSGRVELVVTANVSARVVERVRECSDYNDTADVCEGTWSRSTANTTTALRVSDRRTVRVYDLRGVSARRANYSDSPDGALFHADVPWSQVDFGSDESVEGGWTFYVAGARGWTTMAVTGEDGRTTGFSSVRPVRVHAVPAGDALRIRRPDGTGDARGYDLQLTQSWTENLSVPTLPAEIVVRLPESARSIRGIGVQPADSEDSVDGSVRVTGLVRGVNRTVALDSETPVHATEIDVSVESLSNGTYAANVTVLDDRGRRVTNGHVVVESRAVELANGSVNVTVANPGGFVSVRYVPAPWWAVDRAYRSASRTVMPSPALPSLGFVIDLAFLTAVWCLPVLAIIYAIDVTMNTDFFRGLLVWWRQ